MQKHIAHKQVLNTVQAKNYFDKITQAIILLEQVKASTVNKMTKNPQI